MLITVGIWHERSQCHDKSVALNVPQRQHQQEIHSVKVEELADHLEAAKQELATHSERVKTLKEQGSTTEEIQLFTDNIWFSMNRAQFIQIQEDRLAELEKRVKTLENLLATLQETLDQELGNV